MAAKYTEEQLNSVEKPFLIQLLLQQQEQLEAITKELHASNEKMQLLMEQVILGKQNRFGRSSEKMEDTSQICFCEVDGTIVFFNEAEAVCDLNAAEPEDLELKPSKQAKRRGKKEADLSGLPVRRIDYYLSEEELEAEFGAKGWKQLPDAISRKYHFVPAQVEVEEHHIGVYASKTDEHMVKAGHPKALLHGSLVSPSLAAAIINGKYVNAVPLYRLEQEFQRYGLRITRQNMANWCIRLAEEYLSILYDYLHKELYSYHVIQADETPVLVNHDGRKAGSKSWMWVYRSGHLYQERQIVLYEYQQTRNASHPREFLKGYGGICVTDGYQVYHTLEKELEELTIAGCWVHCRRRFDEALKLIPKSYQKESHAFLLMKQIQAIYREEGKLARAVTYLLNQEKYLRVFLENGEVPMDNNVSERAIRGAENSAIIYSIAETAKANDLKPYEYFEHLLTEIPNHMEDTNRSFLDDLLPWSEKLPKEIKKINKRS